jgi:hypothetical protein
MTRYFFDFTSQNQSLCDYHGDEFLSTHAACQFAEVIAQDLKYSPDGKWADWLVEVRNAEGQKFLSLPVGLPERLAA